MCVCVDTYGYKLHASVVVCLGAIFSTWMCECAFLQMIIEGYYCKKERRNALCLLHTAATVEASVSEEVLCVNVFYFTDLLV